MVVFEALDFGLHVLETGLFGGEGRFFGFWRFDGCFYGCFSVGFGFSNGWFGFVRRAVWGEALGL